MSQKMKRVLKISTFLTSIIIFGIILYTFTGFVKDNSKIEYQIKLNSKTKKFDVEMTIKPGRSLFMDLFIMESRDNKGEHRISNLQVSRENRNITHWKTMPGYSSLERIWLGFNKQPFTVRYSVDPYVSRGDRGKALGFFNDDYAYFRGMYILYMPVTFSDAITFFLKKNTYNKNSIETTLNFSLPDEWFINNPWENSDDIFLSDVINTYWAAGENISQVKSEDISVAVIAPDDINGNKELNRQIISIYREFENITGIKLYKKARYWSVDVLPPVPIHGGASGNYSLLTENDIATISHEIFHWWNGLSIDSAAETNWLKEGFTTYYAGKVLLKTSVWQEQEFKNYLNNLGKGLWKGKEAGPVNLIEASKRLTSGSNSMDDYYQVYNGGAFLAYYLDKELEVRGKSIDEIWPVLYKLEKNIANEDFLNIIENMTDKNFRDNIRAKIEGKIPIN